MRMNRNCKFGDKNCRGCMTKADKQEKDNELIGCLIFAFVITTFIFTVFILNWRASDKMVEQFNQDCVYTPSQGTDLKYSIQCK